ncbi:SprT-like domain-containing protein [Candidatus Woesearchaeota archaeon]|nr:SprT-like domain-containing protein [Candidatus Woesearchaeota archaeon]
MEELASKAFKSLFPQKTPPRLTIKFSGKFSEYNANVRIEKIGRIVTGLEFGLSREFQESDESIIVGVIQHLLNKVYKTNIQTVEQEFYHNFLKHIGTYTKAKKGDDLLEELFEELNEEYFSGLLDRPTMIFGNKTLTVLGNYNYHKDLITISSSLKTDRELIKYVLYHELLHKKHSFKTKNGRGQYHTPAFRADEKKFHDKNIEKKLQKFIRGKKLRKAFFG